LDEELYLDNSGQRTAGTALWKTIASVTGDAPELASARAYLLAQSALNRALTGGCGEAKELARDTMELPYGPAAWFHVGMAEALCGNQAGAESAATGLKQSFPKSSAVAQYYVPVLQAVRALAAKTPSQALELLGDAAPYDQLSLTPYLMGLAHAAEKQAELAAVDFDTVLGHRGSAFVMGGTVYPMAVIGLARASSAAGDREKSAKAYARFAVLWVEADRGQPLMRAVAKRR
jgi:serine/threonine-protein kinase